MVDQSSDREAMAKAAQHIEHTTQEIHDIQSRLQAELSDLAARWTGSGSNRFQRSYSQFDTEIEKIKQDLDKVHSALVESQRSGGRTTA